MGIEITLMNQSYESNYTVVIVLPDTNTAWKVFSSPAYSHTFRYPAETGNGFYVGIAKGVKAGEVLTAQLTQQLTFIAVSGIQKANLIMTGGGLRAPYQFTLLPL